MKNRDIQIGIQFEGKDAALIILRGEKQILFDDLKDIEKIQLINALGAFHDKFLIAYNKDFEQMLGGDPSANADPYNLVDGGAAEPKPESPK